MRLTESTDVSTCGASTLTCRFCQQALQHSVCDLGMSPISNDFVKIEHADQMEPFYPLQAWVCTNCWLVQLGEFQPVENIFASDYVYFSSVSSSWLAHAERYVEMMIERFGFDRSSQVIEIASNDGYLLQYFLERGVPVLGVEPTENTATAALEKGVQSKVAFFGRETAEELRAAGYQADLLLGNNVLAHVPDINDFVAGMKHVLSPDGLITMEFPHLLRLIELNQFDTIYHEHFSYLSLLTVERIFAHHGITLFDVEELPTHGGSLRVFGRHVEDSTHPVTDRVASLKADELAAGLNRVEAYTTFQAQVHATKRDLLQFLIAAKSAGKLVAGYGAPAKGVTLLNYCGVRTDLLAYTVDLSEHKQNMLLPGVRIPVYSPDHIRETKPDYVLILPWNLEKEISDQMGFISEWGARFVVPIPEVKVLD